MAVSNKIFNMIVKLTGIGYDLGQQEIECTSNDHLTTYVSLESVTERREE